MKMKTNKVYVIYCEYCNWKTVAKDFSKLKLNEVPSESKNKKFKCPSCGRLITSKQAPDPQKELEIKENKEKHLEEYKKWIEEIGKQQEITKEEI